MGKLFACTAAGAVLGFIFGSVCAALLDRPRLNPAPWALFVVIATPIGALIGAIFGAVSALKAELAEVQREIKRWQVIIGHMDTEASIPQVKSVSSIREL
jgi:hypothetical protein